jgi:uncharacterized protein YbjT (DUF2867 family)
MILVTGATGTTGGATLRALVRAGVPVRAFVRDAARLEVGAGVEVAIGDFADRSSLDRAFVGVEKAYLVAAPAPGQVELESAFVDAAKRAGIAHLVRLSVIGADQPGADALRFGAIHQALERIVRDSGLVWTFLRPNDFMQNLLGQAQSIASQGVFYSALSPSARVSSVDATDIGDVAARVLTEPGHGGKAYTLTGPEALNQDDVAARLSAVLGREISRVTTTPDEARTGMLGMGYPEWVVDGLVELWRLYETGAVAHVSPDIERVLGRPARSIDDFARENRTLLAG